MHAYVIRIIDTIYISSIIPFLNDHAFAREAERIGTVYPLDDFLEMRKEFGEETKDYYVRSFTK